MSTKNLTTILIPVYNGMPYITKTIDSLFSQTQENWKAIISDNQSDDGTYEYLQTIKDKRVSVVRQKKNIGASKNWEYLYEACDTDYACFLGSDDVLMPIFIETLESIISCNDDVGFIHCAAYLINEDGKITGNYEQDLKFKTNKNEFLRKQLLSNQVNVTSCLFAIKKCKQQGVRFDSSKKLLFDWPLWIDIHIKFEYSIYVDKKICYYRQHYKNMTSSGMKSPEWTLEQALVVLERLPYIDEKVHPKNIKLLATKLLIRTIIRSIHYLDWNMIRNSSIALFKYNSTYSLLSQLFTALKILMAK